MIEAARRRFGSGTLTRHVHGWFCWFDAVLDVFPLLVGRPAASLHGRALVQRHVLAWFSG